MIKFILKRLLFYIVSVPMLIILILYLTNSSTVDPVEKLMNLGEYVPKKEVYQELYEQTAAKHHLDLPLFYVAIKPGNYTEDFFKIKEKKYRKLAEYFLEKGANFNDVNIFLKEAKQMEFVIQNKDLTEQSAFHQIFNKKEYAHIGNYLSQAPYLKNLSESHQRILQQSNINNKLLPRFIFHGFKNQFHRYVRSVFRGNFGRSYIDYQPIAKKLFRALQYTLIFVFMGTILAIPASILWGKISTIYSKKGAVIVLQFLSYVFFAIPMFWLCTLMLVFFTTDEYLWFGKYLSIPKTYLFKEELSPLKNILLLGSSFILPIIAIFLHNFAMFGRQIKTLLSGEIERPYLLTAKMKGLSHSKAINTHAYGNIRIQIITIVSSAITGLFGGSVVIEYIFNIPGMGRLTYESVKAGDIPMLMAIVLIMFTITTIVYSVADYLYQVYNPKVQMS